MMLCSKEAMEAKLVKLETLEEEARLLQHKIDAVKDEIKLNLSGMETAQTDNYTVSWLAVEQNRFDTTTFKKVHTALYEQFLKTVTANRFTYKRR